MEEDWSGPYPGSDEDRMAMERAIRLESYQTAAKALAVLGVLALAIVLVGQYFHWF